MSKLVNQKKWLPLLILPTVALISSPLYSRTNPTLGGFPFFYWYQFVWILLSALITGLVHWKTHD
jgi:hypothetical protein